MIADQTVSYWVSCAFHLFLYLYMFAELSVFCDGVKCRLQLIIHQTVQLTGYMGPQTQP